MDILLNNISYLSKNIWFIVLIPLMFLLSCKNNDYVDYDKALKYCKEKMKDNGKDNKIVVPNPNCLINAKAPVFTSEDIYKNKINLDFKQNEYTILNFWFLECKPCIKELPLLNELDVYHNVKVISVCKNNIEDIQKFIANKDIKISFTVIPNGANIIYGKYKHIFGFPINFLINKNGVIENVFMGLDETEYKKLIKIISN